MESDQVTRGSPTQEFTPGPPVIDNNLESNSCVGGNIQSVNHWNMTVSSVADPDDFWPDPVWRCACPLLLLRYVPVLHSHSLYTTELPALYSNIIHCKYFALVNIIGPLFFSTVYVSFYLFRILIYIVCTISREGAMLRCYHKKRNYFIHEGTLWLWSVSYLLPDKYEHMSTISYNYF